ncbi:MAG: RsmB/NOP family class I SAM-dependent RNA methyltransferase [Candidatus Magasanikbacteria bacterium]|nr:RsmB/NOP family class I SAM-dependent RNA methyltransferase [Candidatus Magasanikbacteria bacterium]
MFHDRSLPEKFLERLTEMFGVSLFREIEKTFVERSTTFRVNTLKSPHHIITTSLVERGFKIRQVSWYKDAFILLNKSKRELTDLDIYNEGKIYIQSLASMIPPLVLDPQPGEKVLDLTAAPGSKTSQIAALMSDPDGSALGGGLRGELVANDNNKIRFFKLKHNMEALGIVCHCEDPAMAGDEAIQDGYWIAALPSVARNDSWRFSLRMEHGGALCREYPEYFDKILLDAPCSAEARFIAGEPKTHGYWKEQKIKEMTYKQWGLLLAAWSALKPGGILVYSTCTFAPEENELQMTKFLERNGDGEILDIGVLDIRRLSCVKLWKNKVVNPDVVKKALRIMPTKEIEGFFVCKLRKSAQN